MKRYRVDCKGKFFKVVVLKEWVIIRNEHGRGFFFETVDYRPQTALA